MTIEAVARQYFRDFLENLGDHVNSYEEFDEEESNVILIDLFFAGRLEVKWNPETKRLMLKPEMTIILKSDEHAKDHD